MKKTAVRTPESRIIRKERDGMKKLSLTVLCAAGVIAGALTIWKIVVPFLSTVIGSLLPG